jgi:hypothetical protein
MPFHKTNRQTGYELAAINNRTGERIFVCMIQGSKSRRIIANTLLTTLSSGKTRLDLVSEMTGHKPKEWRWAKKSAEGCTAGEWSIRFSGRTGLQVDQEGQGRSIYDNEH